MQLVDERNREERLFGANLLLGAGLPAVPCVDDRAPMSHCPAVVTDEGDLVQAPLDRTGGDLLPSLTVILAAQDTAVIADGHEHAAAGMGNVEEPIGALD